MVKIEQCEQCGGKHKFLFCRPSRECDTINHPSHYTKGKYEVIEVIEDWRLGVHRSQIVKYIARAPHKGNPIEDLKKAAWYLSRLIAHLENGNYAAVADPELAAAMNETNSLRDVTEVKAVQ